MEGRHNYENTYKTKEQLEAERYMKDEKYAQAKDDKELEGIEKKKLEELDEKLRRRSMGEQLHIDI